MTDSGLRYDLTVPLSRFYANHANELPSPFKALQIGSVWRADQPQHGRFRQFVQCDIDILGEAGCLAEIELILATTTLLGRLNFSNFKVRLNERRILKAMALYSGFAEEQFDQVFIILDKMDKIGWDGVKAELTETGFDMEKVERYIHMFAELQESEDGLGYLEEKLSGILRTALLGICVRSGKVWSLQKHVNSNWYSIRLLCGECPIIQERFSRLRWRNSAVR